MCSHLNIINAMNQCLQSKLLYLFGNTSNLFREESGHRVKKVMRTYYLGVEKLKLIS